MATRSKKLTKKLLKNLDMGELRAVAIKSMGLDQLSAYTYSNADMVQWIYDRPKELAAADLTKINDDMVRDFVKPFLRKVQKSLLNSEPMPTFKPVGLKGAVVEDKRAEGVKVAQPAEQVSLAALVEPVGTEVSEDDTGDRLRNIENALLFLVNKIPGVSYSSLVDVPRYGGSLDDTDNSV